MKKYSTVFLSFVFALLFLSACDGSGFSVSTIFANNPDIPTGTEVYLDGQLIGEVVNVEPVEAGLQVKLKLDKELVKHIGSNSAVVVNRSKQGAPLEIYNRTSADKTMLQNGQMLKALNSMFELGAWMVGDAIQLGQGTVSDYVESFQDYLKSDEFQSDKDMVAERIESARVAAEQGVKKVEQELARAANDLAASEENAAMAIEKLSEEMAPLMKELGSEGAQMMQQLQQLSAGLAQSDPEQQAAGERFIASLLEALKTLNDGFEDGIESLPQNDAEGSH